MWALHFHPVFFLKWHLAFWPPRGAGSTGTLRSSHEFWEHCAPSRPSVGWEPGKLSWGPQLPWQVCSESVSGRGFPSLPCWEPPWPVSRKSCRRGGPLTARSWVQALGSRTGTGDLPAVALTEATPAPSRVPPAGSQPLERHRAVSWRGRWGAVTLAQVCGVSRR